MESDTFLDVSFSRFTKALVSAWVESMLTLNGESDHRNDLVFLHRKNKRK